MNQHLTRDPGWFAPPGVQQNHNVYFWARLDFQWNVQSGAPTLKIAAESLYRLYLNGQHIADGPCRGTKTLAFYDTHELCSHLKSGASHLEILVGCANMPNFRAAPLRPALWCDLIGNAGHIEYSIRVANADEFARDTPLYTFQTGYTELRDLRVAPRQWQAPEFFTLPKTLLPRDIEMLEITTHRPVEFANSEIAPGTWQIFDFGRMVTGGASVEIAARDGDEIEFGYEETIEDGALRVVHSHPGISGDAYRFYDCFVCREGVQTLGPTLQERGFRYLQVRVVSAKAPVRVLDVRAIDRRHALPPLQTEENDPFRRRLLEMAHHTVSSCATDVLTDCPWREGAFWVNDLVVNARFWLQLGGDTRLVERCLRLALAERNGDGLIYGVCPADGSDRLVFLSTNTFLPLIVRDLRDFDGDWQPFIAPLEEIFQSLRAFEDADGLLVSPPKYWNFLDWSYSFSDHEIGTRACASQSLFYVWALDALSELSGDASWSAHADRVLDGTFRRFWCDARGLFREFDGEETAMHLAQALALLTGRCDNQRESLLSSLDDKNLVRPELYMMNFVLRALVENGREKTAQNLIERFWGPIAQSDDVAIWEANVHQHGKAAFRNSGSLCHAFSCAPLLWLSAVDVKLTTV